MPLVADPFSGHMRSGDPRTPVTAAGGCTWPTVPPRRLMVGSSNATGVYLPFKTSPVLFEYVVGESHHDHAVYRALDQPFWLYSAVVEKIHIKSQHPQFRWWISIMLTIVGRLEIAVVSRTGNCNVNVRWGDQIGGPIRGRVGSGFGFLQVEFDKTTPT